MLLPHPYESCVPRSSSLPSPYDPMPNDIAARCMRDSASVPTGGDCASGESAEKSVLAPASKLKPGERNHSTPTAASTAGCPVTRSDRPAELVDVAPAASRVT